MTLGGGGGGACPFVVELSKEREGGAGGFIFPLEGTGGGPFVLDGGGGGTDDLVLPLDGGGGGRDLDGGFGGLLLSLLVLLLLLFVLAGGGGGLFLDGGGGGIFVLEGGGGTFALEGGGGIFALEGGGGTFALDGGGGGVEILSFVDESDFLKVGGIGGVYELSFPWLSFPTPPVLRSFGIPLANIPANAGPPIMGAGVEPIDDELIFSLLLLLGTLEFLEGSINAALLSFFSESLSLRSFLPFSIDFNKSFLPFEGGGIFTDTGGGGGGPGTIYCIIIYFINIYLNLKIENISTFKN